MKTDYILGVKLNTGMNKQDVICSIAKMLGDGKYHYISTTNAEFIMESLSDPEFKTIINEADLSLPDGIGTLYASYYLNSVQSVKKTFVYPIIVFIKGIHLGVSSLLKNYSLGERLSGADLIYDICDYAQKNNKNVFLLGGWPKDRKGGMEQVSYDLATKTAEVLIKKYPSLTIVGSTSQYSYKSFDDTVTLDFISECMSLHKINHLDILFVAYGHPHQEKWIKRNINRIPARLAIGVGGTFDYISEVQKRAPTFFIKYNIEWLYKLITQPWRFRRIFKAFPLFPLYVFLSTFKHS